MTSSKGSGRPRAGRPACVVRGEQRPEVVLGDDQVEDDEAVDRPAVVGAESVTARAVDGSTKWARPRADELVPSSRARPGCGSAAPRRRRRGRSAGPPPGWRTPPRTTRGWRGAGRSRPRSTGPTSSPSDCRGRIRADMRTRRRLPDVGEREVRRAHLDAGRRARRRRSAWFVRSQSVMYVPPRAGNYRIVHVRRRPTAALRRAAGSTASACAASPTRSYS